MITLLFFLCVLSAQVSCQKTDPALFAVLQSEIRNGTRGCVLIAPTFSSTPRVPHACNQNVTDKPKDNLATAATLKAWMNKQQIHVYLEPFSMDSPFFKAWYNDSNMDLDLLFVSSTMQAFSPASPEAHWTHARAENLIKNIRTRLLKGDFTKEAQDLTSLGKLPPQPTGLWLGLWGNEKIVAMGDGRESTWPELISEALTSLREKFHRKYPKQSMVNLSQKTALEINIYHRLSWMKHRDKKIVDRFFQTGKDSFYFHAAKEALTPGQDAHQFILPRSALIHNIKRPSTILRALCNTAKLKPDCYTQDNMQFDAFRTWNIIETPEGVVLRSPGTLYTRPSLKPPEKSPERSDVTNGHDAPGSSNPPSSSTTR